MTPRSANGYTRKCNGSLPLHGLPTFYYTQKRSAVSLPGNRESLHAIVDVLEGEAILNKRAVVELFPEKN